jgi:hypothetical protein
MRCSSELSLTFLMLAGLCCGVRGVNGWGDERELKVTEKEYYAARRRVGLVQPAPERC